MATLVTMPRYGANMEEGTIFEWHYAEGDAVREGDTICVIETEKLTNEFQAPASGVLRRILCPEGETCECGAPIAVIAEAEEDIASLLGEAEGAADGGGGSGEASAAGAASGVASAGETSGEAAREVSGGKGRTEAAPAPAAGRSAETAGTAGGGKSGGPAAPPPREGAPKITAKARKLAEEKGVDYRGIRGTGYYGAITRQDIKDYLAAGGAAAEKISGGAAAETGAAAAAVGGTGDASERSSAAPGAQPGAPTGGQLGAPAEAPAGAAVPMPQMRKATARTMMKSVSESAQTTIMMDAGADELVRRYRAVKEAYAAEGVKLSYTAAAVKAAAAALREHPQLRTVSEDGETLRTLERIDIGVAVDLGHGLMVPVIRGCGTKDLPEICRELTSLADRAKAGSLSRDDFGGAAMTVSNVGMYGIRYFTPILNPPESAILGLGTLEQEPVIRGGGIFSAWVFALNLTYDHRIVDGVPAARFLNSFRDELNRAIPAGAGEAGGEG